MKVLLGILILAVGLLAGIYAIAGRSAGNEARNAAQNEITALGDQNQPDRDQAASLLVPVLAGVSIAAGAALIGIGMGAFRRPKIVPPDSPDAHKAHTTTGTTR